LRGVEPFSEEAAATAPGQHLLLLRFALFNLAAFALAGAAYANGWIAELFAADGTRLTLAILAVFAVGLTLCTLRVWQVSAELTCLAGPPDSLGAWSADYLAKLAHREAQSRAISAGALRLAMGRRITAVRHLASSLVTLGLIGTVVGFVIALSGVDPAAAGQVDAVAAMVAELIDGMAVALTTTLVGAVLNLWLMADYQILASGAARLTGGLIDLGETRARS
jgi:hypothetical protein